jgi:plasmid maintenance system antidote protein VapI
MTLKEWLTKKDMSLRKFSELMEYTPVHVSRVCRGMCTATDKFAKRLRMLTKGKVKLYWEKRDDEDESENEI